jgi:hypothetical protein
MPGIDDRSDRAPVLTVIRVNVSEVGTFAGPVESELPANVRSQAVGPVEAAHAMAARYLVTDALAAANAGEVRGVSTVRSTHAVRAATWAPTGDAR